MQRRDLFTIGFALFSMFFGAGNVIFPPYLGLGSGSQWFLAFVCYYLADIGLALLALWAVLRAGSPEGLLRRLGPVSAKLLMFAIVLCIGPLLAIPRTAATTYELSVAPLVSGVHPILFSGLFFLVILFLCLRGSAVVDIVGRILTPALLLGLLILIVKGVLDPMGPVADAPLIDSVAATGIEAGYQTMDVLGVLLFGLLVLQSARDKGYTAPRALFRVVTGGGMVAGAALLVVYLGLTYLGAAASQHFDLSVSRTALVLAIVRTLMGQGGVWLFALVVALACITTAAALVSAAAFYVADAFPRVSYPLAAALVSLLSFGVSCFGLERIVAISSPLLHIVYPPVLTLILLTFFPISGDRPFRWAALGALVVSLLTAAATLGAPLPFLSYLPLAPLGFGWLLPAGLCALLGMLLSPRP